MYQEREYSKVNLKEKRTKTDDKKLETNREQRKDRKNL
jgi:hypothetical protein